MQAGLATRLGELNLETIDQSEMTVSSCYFQVVLLS